MSYKMVITIKHKERNFSVKNFLQILFVEDSRIMCTLYLLPCLFHEFYFIISLRLCKKSWIFLSWIDDRKADIYIVIFQSMWFITDVCKMCKYFTALGRYTCSFLSVVSDSFMETVLLLPHVLTDSVIEVTYTKTWQPWYENV